MYKVKRFSGKYSRYLDEIGEKVKDVKEYKEPGKVMKFISKHKVPLAIAATTATAAGTAYAVHRHNKKKKAEAQFSEKKQDPVTLSKGEAAVALGGTIASGVAAKTGLNALHYGSEARRLKGVVKGLRSEKDLVANILKAKVLTQGLTRDEAVAFRSKLAQNESFQHEALKNAKKARELSKFNKKVAIGSGLTAAAAMTATKIAENKRKKAKSSK